MGDNRGLVLAVRMGRHCQWQLGEYPPFESNAIIAWCSSAVFVGSFAWVVVRNRTRQPYVTLTFGMLALACVLRACWLTLRACGWDGELEHFINRFAMYILFSGFTVYLQTWLFMIARRRPVIITVSVVNALLWTAMLGLSIF